MGYTHTGTNNYIVVSVENNEFCGKDGLLWVYIIYI